MKPLISVIVPIYNVEPYLEACLLSIQTQTYAHLEVILIDDGSTDKSAQIAQRFVAVDSRFQLIQQDNAGQSAARNRGIERAKGEYISFIDADDYIALDFYESLLKVISNKDIVQIGYTKTTPQGIPFKTAYPLHRYQLTSAAMRLYRTAFIQKYALRFEEGKIYEDVLFSLDVWRHNPSIGFLHYAGYYYRTNLTSTTSKRHNTRPLFHAIGLRTKNATLGQRLLIYYTMLRLRVHFLLNR